MLEAKVGDAAQFALAWKLLGLMHEVKRYEITVSEIVALEFHRKNIMLIKQTLGDEIVALREEMAGAEGIKPPAVLHETSITRPALRNLNVDRSQDRPA